MLHHALLTVLHNTQHSTLPRNEAIHMLAPLTSQCLLGPATPLFVGAYYRRQETDPWQERFLASLGGGSCPRLHEARYRAVVGRLLRVIRDRVPREVVSARLLLLGQFSVIHRDGNRRILALAHLLRIVFRREPPLV